MGNSALPLVKTPPESGPTLPNFRNTLTWSQRHPRAVLTVSGVLVVVAGVAGLIAGAQ